MALRSLRDEQADQAAEAIAELGVSATRTPASGTAAVLDVLFVDMGIAFEDETDGRQALRQARITVPRSSVDEPLDTDRWTVNGRNWHVLEIVARGSARTVIDLIEVDTRERAPQGWRVDRQPQRRRGM